MRSLSPSVLILYDLGLSEHLNSENLFSNALLGCITVKYVFSVDLVLLWYVIELGLLDDYGFSTTDLIL